MFRRRFRIISFGTHVECVRLTHVPILYYTLLHCAEMCTARTYPYVKNTVHISYCGVFLVRVLMCMTYCDTKIIIISVKIYVIKKKRFD